MRNELDIVLDINGEQYPLRVEARRTLADTLREQCGLTGTNSGCEHGVCGACSVMLDGRPVRSCLMFAVQAEGTLTIAGQSQPAILPGKLYPGGGGLWLDGQYTLKMSTFGIKPPTMMMGTIKVGDAVTIRYHLQFTNREAAGGSSAASGL